MGLRARMKSQASELEALQRVFSLALFQFSPPRSAAEQQQHHHHQHWYGGTKLRPSCNTTSKSEALHACQLSTGLLSLPRKPFRQPASSHTPRPAQVSSFAQGASAYANHLALAAGMTLCYTNRERMRKSTILRRSPAASE